MTANPGPRRRPRRGSLERPVNGRLYRSALFVTALPLLILAFSVTRPGALSAPSLPPSFDGAATQALAAELAQEVPARQPGTPGASQAAQWLRDQLRPYGLPVRTDTWHASVVGLGNVRLQNIWAVAAGQSPSAIVVMAHRDDTGIGPGANDDASGTAALVELAREYASVGAPASQPVRSAHTIVFLSTDGGAYGGLGAARFAAHPPFPIVAVVNLDAIGGHGPPRIVITGDRPRSPAAALVETAAHRVLEQTGVHPRRANLLAQLVDLAFPLTLYEQGPFVAHGIPAVTLTTSGERPPAAFTDRTTALDGDHIAGLGRAAQEIVGSLDQGLALPQGASSYLWAGSRVVRGWPIELLLFTLLLPPAALAVDLFAYCRRRGIPLTPAFHALRARVGFWLFVGAAFYVFRWLGAWPTGVARPPRPAGGVIGNWPVLALVGLAVVALLAWVVERHRLVPRRAVAPEERLAGEAAALLGLAVVALLVVATNPYALIFVLPAMHAWAWLPQTRRDRPARAVLFLLGLAGPALLVGSVALRLGLGLDALWYLVELAALGWVHVSAVAIALAAVACGAQVATTVTGRYAPYAAPGERPPLGPLRRLVRAVVLAVRARRRVSAGRRRAFGG